MADRDPTTEEQLAAWRTDVSGVGKEEVARIPDPEILMDLMRVYSPGQTMHVQAQAQLRRVVGKQLVTAVDEFKTSPRTMQRTIAAAGWINAALALAILTLTVVQLVV